MKNRWVRSLLILALLALAVIALRLTVFRREQVPVTVYRVARGPVEETVTNSKAGTIRTRKRAQLSPEFGGRVAALDAKEGDKVTEGEALLRLDDAEYRSEVSLQERALAAAQPARREACLAARQAERDYERTLRLTDDAIISEERLEQLGSERDVAAAACDRAEARVREAEGMLDLARVRLAKTVVRAPFDGVVAEVSTEVGEWISPSPPGLPIPPVLELIQTESIYLSAPLDEVDVGRVRVGLPVRITIDAYPDRAFAGSVARVAPYVLDIEEHSRTFEIEVEFDDQDFARTLLPGASADVEVILRSRADVLRIPSYALIQGGRVLVVNDRELIDREVGTGLRNWAFTEITGGLDAGELVVVSLDRAEVQEGARVRIAGETEK
jgi:HlyD family secretion protein